MSINIDDELVYHRAWDKKTLDEIIKRLKEI